MARLWVLACLVASLAACREPGPVPAVPVPPVPTLPSATLPELPHGAGDGHAPPVPPPTTTTIPPDGAP